MNITHRKYLLVLSLLFTLEWLILAVSPLYRHDWLLENILVFLAIPLLALSYQRFVLSRISYTLIFIFLALHEVGAHYTYAEVPYDQWFEALFGTTFNSLVGWERNNFDRVVHFAYGLLLAYPVREFVLRVVNARGFWGYFLPLALTMASSMLYELIEWGAALVFGGELGMAYLGTQGDIWDGHKDMALASLGTLVSMMLTAGLNIFIQRDFAAEWAESLRVKQQQPLGEDEVMRLLQDQKKSETSL